MAESGHAFPSRPVVGAECAPPDGPAAGPPRVSQLANQHLLGSALARMSQGCGKDVCSSQEGEGDDPRVPRREGARTRGFQHQAAPWSPRQPSPTVCGHQVWSRAPSNVLISSHRELAETHPKGGQKYSNETFFTLSSQMPDSTVSLNCISLLPRQCRWTAGGLSPLLFLPLLWGSRKKRNPTVPWKT